MSQLRKYILSSLRCTAFDISRMHFSIKPCNPACWLTFFYGSWKLPEENILHATQAEDITRQTLWGPWGQFLNMEIIQWKHCRTERKWMSRERRLGTFQRGRMLPWLNTWSSHVSRCPISTYHTIAEQYSEPQRPFIVSLIVVKERNLALNNCNGGIGKWKVFIDWLLSPLACYAAAAAQ